MRHAWIVIIFLGVMQPIHTEADSFSREAVLEQFSRDSWYVGKGIIPGDFFSYAVCDFEHKFLEQTGSCYHVRMDFHIKLESQGRDVWVVQAEISDSENTNSIHRHIFLMDTETLDITTDHIGRDYAISLQKTIMYLAQFAHEQVPKPLIVGKTWGSVSSTLNVGSDLVVSSKEASDLGNVFVLDFGLFEPSTFVISKDISFPISALIFDPHYPGIDPPILFTFEMLDHASGVDLDPSNQMIPDSSNGTVIISGFVNP